MYYLITANVSCFFLFSYFVSIRSICRNGNAMQQKPHTHTHTHWIFLYIYLSNHIQRLLAYKKSIVILSTYIYLQTHRMKCIEWILGSPKVARVKHATYLASFNTIKLYSLCVIYVWKKLSLKFSHWYDDRNDWWFFRKLYFFD